MYQTVYLYVHFLFLFVGCICRVGDLILSVSVIPKLCQKYNTYEPRHEKTNDLHICENKDADQLRGDREADQRLCFRYTDRKIPLLSKSEISSL